MYSAPEMFYGVEAGIISDVWSAGCVIYEMLTKKNPWNTIKSDATIKDIRNFLD